MLETGARGIYEVEFCDEDGKAYAMVALKEKQLMRLYLSASTGLRDSTLL